ncbi:hypothetical protein HPB47_022604 [Ixodes persulcatus]|uniref:Uncharacterized protein n=1 Tax=Ixodes persulcatus TaxID=34615 RepID=A0AC60Q9Z3_IXOPE|nr:hypothetical protein HPB47_022604 [Ixodes persulcatus]
MDDNAALANEFELRFSDLTPTEWEILLRTQNSGLALYEGAPDLPTTSRSRPQSDLAALKGFSGDFFMVPDLLEILLNSPNNIAKIDTTKIVRPHDSDKSFGAPLPAVLFAGGKFPLATSPPRFLHGGLALLITIQAKVKNEVEAPPTSFHLCGANGEEEVAFSPGFALLKWKEASLRGIKTARISPRPCLCPVRSRGTRDGKVTERNKLNNLGPCPSQFSPLLVFCCTVHTEACAGDQLRPMGPYQITQPRVWPLPLTINLVQPGDYGQLLGHPLQAVSPAEVERIVALHNDLRNDLASGNMAGFPSAANMLRLEYDGELAQLAQIHSQSCQFQHGCVGCGRIDRYLGQNLFLSPRGNWEQAIMTWWNEHRRTNSFTIYNYQFSPLNGHFTQMAWAKNIKIGCGATDCHQLGGARYMVCHYIPGTDFATTTRLTRFRFRRDGNMRITGVLESSDGENVATGAYGGLLIGHSGCPCRAWQIAPFRSPTAPVECAYNQAYGRTQFVIASLQAVCWASKLVVDKGVPVSVGLVVLVALPTAAVLPQAEGAPHPRPAASPKAGYLSFPRLRHLEENDPGGHKDLVAEGPTFWANHISCWLHIDWCFANPED